MGRNSRTPNTAILEKVTLSTKTRIENGVIKMKTMKLLLGIFIIGVLFIALSTRAYSQQWYSAATYQVSFPSGDTKDFANGTSWRGVGLDFRKSLNWNTTVGFFFGWNVFHERINGTIQLKTDNPGAVTGLQDRYINSFPIMVNVHRYLGERGSIRPYLGVNAGGFIMLQRFEIGVLALQKDQWQWGFAPEIGFLIPLQSGATLFVNGKYNYAFTGASVLGGDIRHSYFNLNIGFAWSQF